MIEKCPNVKLTIKYIENPAVNALAVKGRQSQEDYLIAVFAGLVLRLKEIYFSETFIANVRSNLKVLNILKSKNLALNCLSYGLAFTYFHEVGHVYRGHLNYFPKQQHGGYIWDELCELASPNNSPDFHGVNRRHLSECDADAFAGMMVGGQIFNGSSKILANSIFGTASHKEILNDLLFIASVAIHTVFCIFNEKETPKDGNYPHPTIRSAILHGHIGQKLCSLSDVLNTTEITARFHDSIITINNISKYIGIHPKSEVLESTFVEWQKKYWQLLAMLGEELIPHSPCKQNVQQSARPAQ
jgi:hypothetical protein